ncbi:MAG: ATP cone domain-containing protein [Candidatus Aenigmatarchaeota archaeon]
MAYKYVIKKDGSKQRFSKAKIAKGCRKAGAKPAVAIKVANAVAGKCKSGVKTKAIGLMVIKQLGKYDKKAAANFKKYFMRKK